MLFVCHQEGHHACERVHFWKSHGCGETSESKIKKGQPYKHEQLSSRKWASNWRWYVKTTSWLSSSWAVNFCSWPTHKVTTNVSQSTSPWIIFKHDITQVKCESMDSESGENEDNKLTYVKRGIFKERLGHNWWNESARWYCNVPGNYYLSNIHHQESSVQCKTK